MAPGDRKRPMTAADWQANDYENDLRRQRTADAELAEEWQEDQAEWRRDQAYHIPGMAWINGRVGWEHLRYGLNLPHKSNYWQGNNARGKIYPRNGNDFVTVHHGNFVVPRHINPWITDNNFVTPARGTVFRNRRNMINWANQVNNAAAIRRHNRVQYMNLRRHGTMPKKWAY